jgi:phosphoglycerol transferase MdoB-like AlkP superfamily enzyme
VIALLTILTAGLLVGRFARRITPLIELLLLLVVAAIVLIQLVVWNAGVNLSVSELLHGTARRVD